MALPAAGSVRPRNVLRVLKCPGQDFVYSWNRMFWPQVLGPRETSLLFFFFVEATRYPSWPSCVVACELAEKVRVGHEVKSRQEAGDTFPSIAFAGGARALVFS